MKPAATALAIALAAASMLAGCGSSGGETTSAPEPLKRADTSGGPIGAAVRRCPTAGVLTRLRVSGLSCQKGAVVMSSWNFPRCRPAQGESRSACTVRRYRCLSVRTDRGTAVNCSRPGRSISFLWKP
ncbi:MAG: hypothetical protein ACXWZM_00590 [Solirubrobacterales bacterium]